jgi:DNA-binding transcriptional regulator YiaG
MPNIATALKEEITRLARKELKANTESLKKAVASYRSEIAALKRRVAQLERQGKRTTKAVSQALSSEPQEEATNLRFRVDGFKAHRERLGLSAADYAALIGVSALSVYKWESGQARPRARYLAAIAAVRNMGKREAAKCLEELAS